MFLGNPASQSPIPNILQNAPPLKSLPFQEDPHLRHLLDRLPSELQSLYQILFNGEDRPIDLKQALPFQSKRAESHICHKQLKRKEKCFHCLDCSLHEGTLFCEECFRQGDHKNHRYLIIQDEGCCDCGDVSFLKKQGFCSRHQSVRRSAQVYVSAEDRLRFRLYMKQVLVWMFTLWSKVSSNAGAYLLIHVIEYLCVLNQQSPHYNLLTTELLFEGNIPIISQMFQIIFTASVFQRPLTKKFLEFLLLLMACQQFREALFLVFLDLYNTCEAFETSGFEKVLVMLMSDSNAITSIMPKANLSLDPSGRQYKPKKYYQYLLTLSLLEGEVVQMFLRPLLSRSFVDCPLLRTIEENCEQKNGSVISIASENAQEEYMYYRVVQMIINVVNSEQLLKLMIRNYYRMLRSFSFKNNKIVLIPHRVLALLLFKYAHFATNNLNLECLCQIFEMPILELREFLVTYLRAIVGCLGQFSLDLVRNTYFYNYRGVYLSEASQAVMIDYLGLRLIAHLFAKYPQELGSVPALLYYDCYLREQSQLDSQTAQLRRDHLSKWNKLLEVLVEVVYSPKIHIINCLFLSEAELVGQQARQLIASIAKKLGSIGKADLELMKKHLFYGRCKEDWIAQTLVLNKQTFKYRLRQSLSTSDIPDINFDHMVSFAHTQLNHLMKNEQPRRLQLTQQTRSLAAALLDPEILSKLVIAQLDFACTALELSENFQLLQQIIRITITLTLFTSEPEEYSHVIEKCRQIAKDLGSNCKEDPTLASRSKNLIEEIEQLVEGRKWSQRKGGEDERERRRALQNAKKERLMRERKMKENQQIYVEKTPTVSSGDHEGGQQQCLICRQKEKRWNLCYLSKIKLNNVLYDHVRFPEKHFIFCTCYHMVHFECFSKNLTNRKSLPCPLCQTASNIVLPEPRALLNSPWLVRLYHMILRRMTELGREAEALAVEVMLFCGYVGLTSLNRRELGSRSMELLRSVYRLVLFEHSQFLGQKSESIDEFKTTNDFNLSKFPQNSLRRCMQNVVLFLENSIKLTASGKEGQISDLANHVTGCLSNFFSPFTANKIIALLSQIVSAPVFEPIVVEQLQSCKDRPISFLVLPGTLAQFFRLRDECTCKKSPSHIMLQCVLCTQKLCAECGDIKQHTLKLHLGEALFFNLQAGGFRYFREEIELNIQSIFVDQMGTVWHPKRGSSGFQLDYGRYREICEALESGNLFYYLTHSFEGLKGKGISDFI